MIRTFLAVDTQDEDLGGFFSDCSEDLLEFGKTAQTEIQVLNGNTLNDIYVNATLENLNHFIFLVYSHGSERELVVNGATPFISVENASSFQNSFFYTCSCHAGKELGDVLINAGCLSFIGYKGKFEIWDFNRTPFIECANHGIKLFLSGEKTSTIVEKMKEKYSEHIDNYNNDIFGAAILLSNRRALVKKGGNISLNDLAE